MDLYSQAYQKMQERKHPVMFAESHMLENNSLYLMDCSTYNKVASLELSPQVIPNNLKKHRLMIEHIFHHKVCLGKSTKSWEIKYKANEFAAKHIRKYAPQLRSDPVLFEQIQKLLVDHMAKGNQQINYFFNPSTQWSVSGWLKKDQDKIFSQRLLQLGAKIVDHTMALPDYKSWAEISPGQKLSLQDGDTTITYIPHYQTVISSKPLPIPCYKFDCDLNKQQKSQLLKVVSDFYSFKPIQHGLRKIKFLQDVKNDKGYEKVLLLLSTYSSQHKLQFNYYTVNGLASTLSNTNFFPERTQEYLKDLIWERVLENQFDKIEYEGKDTKGWFKAVQAEEIAHIPLDNNFALISSNNHASSSIVSFYNFIEDLEAFSFVLHDSDVNKFKDLIRERFKAVRQKIPPKLFEQIITQIVEYGNICKTQHSVLSPTAPLSERGHLQITPAPKNFAQYQRISYLLGLKEKIVPTSVGYQSNKRVVNKQQIEDVFPKDKMIIHGITGVTTFGQAYSRLRTIFIHGGLYSSSERRRMGFSGKTLSPLGDSASGIDWAVPATINSTPSYGNKIFFVFHNRLLLREDIFFAPYDFGAGKDRWPNYQYHANLLGQYAIHTACPLKAVNNQLLQLNHNTVKTTTNEVCFGRGIALNDIAAIVYEAGTYPEYRQNKIEEIIAWAKSKDILQNDIAVLPYNHDTVKSFQEANKYTWL